MVCIQHYAQCLSADDRTRTLTSLGDDWIPSSYELKSILIMMMMPITKLLLIKCVEHLEDAYVTLTEQMAHTHFMGYVIPMEH